MTEFDPVEFGRSIGAMIREAVEPLKSENAELRKEIDALKAREPVKGEKGDPGKDADPEAVVAEAVKRLLDEERLETVVSLCAAKAVHEYLSEHPIPAPKDGERGPQGEKGDPGKDGVGVRDLLIDRDGCLVATFEDGRTKNLGPVVGKDGAPGQDGRDGADLTEIGMDFDGERTVTIKGRTGTVTKRVPVPLWRGYWSPGVVAEKGDILTHNGTAYIAIVDNPKCEPGVGKYDHEWKVFARKGRDGKDGRNGIDKTAPVKVTPEDPKQ